MHRIARARLASRVIRRLRRAGMSDVRYDARAFTVRFRPDGDDVPTVVPLEGLPLRGGRRERDAVVDGFLRAPGPPDQWEQVRPLLRPVLRGSVPTTDISAPLRRAVLPFLAEYVVVDQPDTMTYVAQEQVRRWGATDAEVFDTARANLTGAVLHGVASGQVVVQFIDDGDAYWTSHLLLDGWLARLADQVGGRPVAFAPERGTLLVTADGGAHLAALFHQAEQAFLRSPRAISPMAYVSGESGRTVPYAVPPDHPLHDCIRRARALLQVHEYTRQAQTLADAAPIWVVDGLRTRTEHAPGRLLPEADDVLVDGAVRRWDEFATTPVPGLQPPRWRRAGE
ncbi:hypothetical protein [Mangrovihabitans endophyticus]|nr:hypothetical protein [Mangrovihabitans endophyticus]